MVKGFLMHLGYVESSSNACLLFKHNKGFDTVESALSSLRECFMRVYEQTHSVKSHPFKGEGKYCSDCGKFLQSHIPFSWDLENYAYRELIEEEVRIWFSGDADSTHSMYEILESAGWDGFIGNLESLENIIKIEQCGENCISQARLV